jgi:hypothetical protein
MACKKMDENNSCHDDKNPRDCYSFCMKEFFPSTSKTQFCRGWVYENTGVCVDSDEDGVCDEDDIVCGSGTTLKNNTCVIDNNCYVNNCTSNALKNAYNIKKNC